MKLLQSRRHVAGVAVLVVILLIVGIGFGTRGDSVPAPTTSQLLFGNAPNTQVYVLETVTTVAGQTRGLSGRSSLDDGTGMLFIYPVVADRCMWMKDMRFNIDIIWLGSDRRVTSIVADLSPMSYPQSYCAMARYVVELPAGAAAKQGLRVGQVVDLR